MKKIIFFTIIIISFFIIKNLMTSIYTLWQKQDLIVQAQKELEEEKKKNIHLKDQLSTVEESTYIEEQARNKLFLVKPNEQGILISKNLLEASSSSKKGKEEKPETWRLWWNLFFK